MARHSVLVLLMFCLCIWDPTNASAEYQPMCTSSDRCVLEEHLCIDKRCVDRCKFLSNLYPKCFPPAPICKEISPSGKTTEPCICKSNSQCWEGYICVNQSCLDPCVNRCGANATCELIDGFPNCACIHGHIGNPVKGCKPKGKVAGAWPPATGMKKYLAVTNIKLKWLDAYVYCLNQNMRLARVESEQENNDIVEMFRKAELQNTTNVWIDGTDIGDEGNWFWLSTSKKIGSYKNWINRSPKKVRRGEHCLSYYKCGSTGDQKWNDRSCRLRLPFICEDYE